MSVILLMSKFPRAVGSYMYLAPFFSCCLLAPSSPPPACLQVAILIHFDFVSSQPISRNPAWQVPTVPPKRLSSIITLAHMQSRWWRRRQNVLGATGAFVSGPNRRCSTTLEQSPRAVVEQGFEIWRARYLKNDFESIKPRPCRHAGGRDARVG